jgi:uncharacterized protein YndB with AHSA1/START domain
MVTATDEDTRLAIRRVYPYDVAVVYAACTDPQEMKHWMAASDAYESEITSDFRVGGRYRIVMRGDDQQTHRVGGIFREIAANRRLVYTWAWESTPERESLVTVEFRALEAGTEVLLTHERFADRDARDRHHEGWTACVARLDRRLAHHH